MTPEQHAAVLKRFPELATSHEEHVRETYAYAEQHGVDLEGFTRKAVEDFERVNDTHPTT